MLETMVKCLQQILWRIHINFNWAVLISIVIILTLLTQFCTSESSGNVNMNVKGKERYSSDNIEQNGYIKRTHKPIGFQITSRVSNKLEQMHAHVASNNGRRQKVSGEILVNSKINDQILKLRYKHGIRLPRHLINSSLDNSLRQIDQNIIAPIHQNLDSCDLYETLLNKSERCSHEKGNQTNSRMKTNLDPYETSSLTTINDTSNIVHIDSSSGDLVNNKTKLYVGGLFDLSGSRGEALGKSELTAAKLAVDHINRKNLLDGYELKLRYNDTGCDPGVGMDALYDLIYRGEQMLMVTGSACSEVTKTLAEIVPYWNLILVSFASTSPALSAREKYKAFFRLAPADSSQNEPRAIFITHFGWNTVATLYEIEEDHSLAIDEMGNTFEQNSIAIKISRSFRRFDDIYDNLQAIKKQDVRIIVGSFSEKAARHVLCAAYQLEMYGSRYVWMLISDYVERWWELANDTTCSPEQLAHVAEGYFTVDSLSSLSEGEDSYANITVNDFLHDYDKLKGPRPLSPFATTTYDSLWAIALTLKGSLERWQNGSSHNVSNTTDILQSFTYEGGATIRNTFFEIMQNLGFLGISGPISFDGPDRKGISVIGQNQGGYIIRIALYEPDKRKLNFNCRSCRPILWKNGRAPRDKYITVTRQKNIGAVYYICVSGVSAAGLVLAVVFLGFNLHYRKLRYIKLSSPKLNNVAVVGCMLVYTAIMMLGFNASELQQKYFPFVCTLRAFLFAAGFSLSFGAMFTKTYRVHQIFTRASGGLIKSKLLRDKQLLSIIGALLVVDSVILVLWIAIDPMQKKITDLNVEASDNDEDLLIISQLTTCHSTHIEKWTGALYAYKGLLLVFGVYMAWETRHVKIPALNDSHYIGLNVYNVVMMSVLVVTLSNILSRQPTLAYVLESSLMLISTTTTLCLLFVPKIYALATTKGDPIIAASGITVDTNCRRFAVDEKREQYFRAEVQNRVYRREIVEMDQEIHRLERLLELPMEPYPRLTKEQLCRLPESKVDPTPPSVRKQRQEGEIYSSMSEDSEICVGITTDDKSEPFGKFVLKVQQPTPKLTRRRPNRMSIRDATSYAVSKLCKLRPRFSIGSINFRHEYEGMKTSPDDKLDSFTGSEHLGIRTRVSHPLLRQEAVEERRNHLLSTIKHASEKSETQTFETQLSDNDVDHVLEPEVSNLRMHFSSSMSDFHLLPKKDYLAPPTSGYCPDDIAVGTSTSSFRRKRKLGYVRTSNEHCKISPVEMLSPEENASPRFRRARSIIEHERRTRIRKLQSDLRKIQKELEDLDELEYEVSVV